MLLQYRLRPAKVAKRRKIARADGVPVNTLQTKKRMPVGIRFCCRKDQKLSVAPMA